MEYSDYLMLTARLLLAVLIGGAIGLERTFQGRPAGFRTHVLVCLSSCLMMLMMVFQLRLVEAEAIELVRYDPSRMAQGIMTGIGFLGAGVIIKDNLTIRGLTTAASIWMTASLGIAIGAGFYEGAIAFAVICFLVLGLFRKVERIMPCRTFAQVEFYCPSYAVRSRLGQDIKVDMEKIGFKTGALGVATMEDGGVKYTLRINTTKVKNFEAIKNYLYDNKDIVRFDFNPETNV